ncbi:hypothetical protein Sjap_015755 [Stephania japonica]|uniref:non-specific serine/threonine protein kinase n=1 Tax=Stephania japonica TaxID=461633 RepID=A0AAP0IKT9_9MAGN
MVVTEKCDVYSFGVVALEVIMGKHPRDLISSLSSPHYRNIMLKDVVDKRLTFPTEDEKSVALIMALAILCTQTNPLSRPTMKQISEELIAQFVVLLWNYDGQIAYEDIIREIEDFDIKYFVGVGGYISIYRALLQSGKVVALKKFHNWERENLTFERSFTTKIQILTKIRHRNIVRLYEFCCHTRCAFLVYEYLEKGSLFVVLAEEVEAVVLDWKRRINLIKGISSALSYLHHDCSPPIIHRDISSNNILLDSEYEAHVADFGTARLLDLDSSNQTILASTYGYIVPAYPNDSSPSLPLHRNFIPFSLADQIHTRSTWRFVIAMILMEFMTTMAD